MAAELNVARLVELAFSEGIPCEGECGGVTFQGEHICSESAHLQVCLESILSESRWIRMGVSAMAAAVCYRNMIGHSVAMMEPTVVYVNPAGIVVTRGAGRGFNVHPLTRLIFWRVWCARHPRAEILPGALLQLEEDLVRYRFLSSSFAASNFLGSLLLPAYLDKIVQCFTTGVCMACMQVPTHRRVMLRDHDWSQIYPATTCRDEENFRFHLMVMGIIRNGWKFSFPGPSGCSFIVYLGRRQSIFMRDGSLWLDERECSIGEREMMARLVVIIRRR